MVVQWDDVAISKLNNIFQYYSESISRRRALKIKKELFRLARLLAKSPYMGAIFSGTESSVYTYRSFIVEKHYRMIYRIEDETIFIITIWDVRQDPESLNLP